jgi:hypothetical protein
MLPVVYIHTGTIPAYLVRSLEQAKSLNPSVFLITDVKHKQDGIVVVNVHDLSEGLEDFRSVYEHMSTNSRNFEMICIERWFILRNFMKKNLVHQCYYSDSDVMIYSNLEEVFPAYEKYEAAYTMPEYQDGYRWTASACCSFWKLNTIEAFCDFIMHCYSLEGKKELMKKWEHHRKNSIPGGVCDMTLLHLFSKERNFISLSKVHNGMCFDQNMLDDENYFRKEYEMEKRFGEDRLQKKIYWKDGIPYGNNLVEKKQVRFIVLTEYAKLLGQKKTIFHVLKNMIKKMIR